MRYQIDSYKHGIIDQHANGMLVCEESAAEQYFAKKTNATKKKAADICAQIAKLSEELDQLREKCRHTNTVHQYKSDTGNYDPSHDRYWITFRCYDCGKFWIKDQ